MHPDKCVQAYIPNIATQVPARAHRYTYIYIYMHIYMYIYVNTYMCIGLLSCLAVSNSCVLSGNHYLLTRQLALWSMYICVGNLAGPFRDLRDSFHETLFIILRFLLFRFFEVFRAKMIKLLCIYVFTKVPVMYFICDYRVDGKLYESLRRKSYWWCTAGIKFLAKVENCVIYLLRLKFSLLIRVCILLVLDF